MEKIKSLLTSKKFWTLVAAIVTALTVFFTTGCATQIELRRKGLHCDSVEYYQIIKSNNFNKSVLWSQVSSFKSPLRHVCGNLRLLSMRSVSLSNDHRSSVSLKSPVLSFWSSGFPVGYLSSSLKLFKSSIGKVSRFLSLDSVCSIPEYMSSLTSTRRSRLFSDIGLLALVPLAVPISGSCQRRGGRRGRPSGSKIKNIPLGGRHL